MCSLIGKSRKSTADVSGVHKAISQNNSRFPFITLSDASIQGVVYNPGELRRHGSGCWLVGIEMRHLKPSLMAFVFFALVVPLVADQRPYFVFGGKQLYIGMSMSEAVGRNPGVWSLKLILDSEGICIGRYYWS
jgi:hypothetical protein